jgi:DNA polymerase III subunit delta
VTKGQSVCLVVGDDPLLVSRAIGEAIGDAGPLSVDELPPDADIAIVRQGLETSSMFEDRRVVVIKDIELASSDLLRYLTAYLADPNPGALLVLAGAKAPAALISAAKEAGRVVEATAGNRSDLFAWLKREAAKAGIRMTGEGMAALVEAAGAERLALKHAVEELALALGPKATAGPEEVRRQFHSRADAKVFAFVDAVAARDASAALQILHRLVSAGESEQGLFWMLARHLRMLLVAGSDAPPAVASRLRIPAWRAEKLFRQARAFTEQELTGAYQTLAAADRKIKTSEEPDLLALEKAVVAIAGARPSRGR